jgi:hypothetical protein
MALGDCNERQKKSILQHTSLKVETLSVAEIIINALCAYMNSEPAQSSGKCS